MLPRTRLEHFETEVDNKMGVHSLWDLPLRSILTYFFLIADSLFTGGRFVRENQPRAEAAMAWLSRISYLVRFLGRSPLQIGANVDDALSVFNDPQEQYRDVLTYAHFCEIMPGVRREYYHVESVTGGFRLQHPNDAHARAEEKDIIFTELSLALATSLPESDPGKFDRMIRAWPALDGRDIVDALFAPFEHYLTTIQEPALLPNDAYQSAFGFARNEFQCIRAALMALADFCLGMANAAERQVNSGMPGQRTHWERECREWAAPLLNANFILGTIEGVTRVPAKVIDEIIKPLTIDARRGDFENAGDGYLPPLVRFDEGFLFSPYALRSMLPERNLLYVLNKRKRHTFDRLVGGYLEPALLDQAELILRKLPNLCIKRNVTWKSGEIDLLAFEPESNSALQIQVKSAIPPQGYRMTQQVETHTVKAASQLNIFESESAQSKDEICSRAIGRTVSKVKWISAVLSRSGLGTWRGWSAIEPYVAINVRLLRGVVERMQLEPMRRLVDFSEVTGELLEEIIHRAAPRWRKERIVLFETGIEIPILDLDNNEIQNVIREMTS